MDAVKALALLGFLDGNIEFTPLEDRIGNQDVGKTYVFFVEGKRRCVSAKKNNISAKNNSIFADNMIY